MTDLITVVPNELITAERMNLIQSYIQDGTHKLNTLSINIGGVEAITSTQGGIFSSLKISSLSGMLKAASGTVSVAVAGTDYLENLSSSTIGDLSDVDLTGLVNSNVLVYNSTSGNFEPGTVSSADEKVKISTNDTTTGYLESKLVAGTEISITKNNSSANETLTIDADVDYTNATPSVVTVGGIDSGTTFTDQTMTEMWTALLYPELFGTLTTPSSTFTSTITGYREIDETIASITFDAAFYRGSINPQYDSSSEYRSGLPNTYVFTGTDLSNQSKTDLTDQQVISNYDVVSGAQSWTGRVAYDEGVQPVGSQGTNFDSPLAAGNTSIVTRTITGVYPYYATTSDITVLTKQTLTSMSATYVQTNVVAESGGNKQTADFPTGWSSITGIQFYNTVSTAWEWINGSNTNSLLTFTASSTTHIIQGNSINYDRYTHNGSTIGARNLRWYTT